MANQARLMISTCVPSGYLIFPLKPHAHLGQLSVTYPFTQLKTMVAILSLEHVLHQAKLSPQSLSFLYRYFLPVAVPV